MVNSVLLKVGQQYSGLPRFVLPTFDGTDPSTVNDQLCTVNNWAVNGWWSTVDCPLIVDHQEFTINIRTRYWYFECQLEWQTKYAKQIFKILCVIASLVPGKFPYYDKS